MLWYLVPAAGAAALVACGLAGANSLATRIVGIVAVVVAAIAWVAFAHLAGARRLGWGPKLALAGALAIAADSWLPHIEHRVRSLHRAQ